MIAQTIFVKGTTDSVFAYADNQNRLKEFELYQNYPNPFNPSTTIQFYMPEAGKVSLKVFNLLGEEITTLLDDYKDAGNHKFSFDGRSLGSGIYFYKLDFNQYSSVKKMIILK
jgi:hypothetical protein